MNHQLLIWLLALHAGAALFMAGLIWFVQVVHYPLFDRVGQAGFTAYEQQHVRRTGWVVIGPMLLEAGLAAILAWSPGGWQAWCGLALLAIIWLSTFLGQVPTHDLLGRGFDAGAHRRLVVGNWVRTAGWSMRGVLAMAMLITHGIGHRPLMQVGVDSQAACTIEVGSRSTIAFCNPTGPAVGYGSVVVRIH